MITQELADKLRDGEKEIDWLKVQVDAPVEAFIEGEWRFRYFAKMGRSKLIRESRIDWYPQGCFVFDPTRRFVLEAEVRIPESMNPEEWKAKWMTNNA